LDKRVVSATDGPRSKYICYSFLNKISYFSWLSYFLNSNKECDSFSVGYRGLRRCITYKSGCTKLDGPQYANAKHFFMADCKIDTEVVDGEVPNETTHNQVEQKIFSNGGVECISARVSKRN